MCNTLNLDVRLEWQLTDGHTGAALRVVSFSMTFSGLIATREGHLTGLGSSKKVS